VSHPLSFVADAVSQTNAVVAGAQRFSLVPEAHARNMALDVEIATLRAIFQPDAVDQQKHHCDHPTNTFRCVTFVKQPPLIATKPMRLHDSRLKV
jgi:hypothetical protein